MQRVGGSRRRRACDECSVDDLLGPRADRRGRFDPADPSDPSVPAQLPVSDEFDRRLADWHVSRGDDVGEGTRHVIATRGGVLEMEPRRSWWANATQGPYVWQPVRGDFIATVRVSVTGKATTKPTANWTLSGILARDPASTNADEDWVSVRTGVVDGRWVAERKTTTASVSTLDLARSGPGWQELRLARLGDRFFLLRRQAEEWRLWWVYRRPDLPVGLQLGLDAFSGYDSETVDLVARADWVRFVPLRVPPSLRDAPGRRLLPLLTRR